MDNEPDILEPYYDFFDSDLLKLEIKPTNLPFKGLGLFATGHFSKGEVIAEYYGSIVSAKASQSQLFNQEDKLVQVDEQICVIGRCPASRINDIVAFNSSCYQTQQYNKFKELKEFPIHKGFKTNARLALESKQKVLIKSTREIIQGEEIYMGYGFSYWDFFHQYQHEKRLGSSLQEKLLSMKKQPVKDKWAKNADNYAYKLTLIRRFIDHMSSSGYFF